MIKSVSLHRAGRCAAVAVWALTVAAPASAQAPAPTAYDAVTDRLTRVEPPLPSLGDAGFLFNDPTFGSRLLRVTDGRVRPARLDRSYRTPSASHQNAWNTTSRYFYVMSTDGTVVPYQFDPASLAASRINPSTAGDGGLTLSFQGEPQFSHVEEHLIYGVYRGSTLRVITAYDFSTGLYKPLLNLDTMFTTLAGTYVGGLSSSAGAVERVLAFFGGTGQDRHHRVVVFEKNNPARRRVIDTLASTIDGVAAATLLNFKLHHAYIDRSGRYVMLSPTSPDRQAPRYAAPHYVWDLQTNAITPLTRTAEGHNTLGYQALINQSCCTTSTWDAAQWQFRWLSNPAVPRDVISPVLTPKEVYLGEHSSWNNARPDLLVPYFVSTYRYGNNTAPWRAWDDEIIAIDPAAGAAVYRIAHHRSNVASDVDPLRSEFWAMPRVNVSPDGRWATFTSNWEKTLGLDAGASLSANSRYRQDVFIVELTPASAPLAVATTSLPAGEAAAGYAAALQATGGAEPYAWSLSSGALPPGVRLTPEGVMTGAPTSVGTWEFNVTVTDSQRTPARASATFTITIVPEPNKYPLISLTSSANGPAALGSTVRLTAAAADLDGFVRRVDFFVDGKAAGSDETAPFTFDWFAASSGKRTFTAVATDNEDASTGSAPLDVNTHAEVVVYASDVVTKAGNFSLIADATAAGGQRLWNRNYGGAKIATASAMPASYAEFRFYAEAGRPYHFWMRGKADNNHWANDSFFVQFSGSVDASGAATRRIGTTDAMWYAVEDDTSAGLAGWGWNDNAYGRTVMGANIYFDRTGMQTIRIQQREDGLSIDQIVLSPVAYLSTSPGALKNDTTIVPR
jgi:hypothetical protein